ncbi:hypothetical protein, partial [Roseateles sp.]|uniref:hypothetical protein n=1 Tax=Roseateles sp. TaxID=1971397 RepID=UPI00326415D7
MTSTPERDNARVSPHPRSRIGCALAVVATTRHGRSGRSAAHQNFHHARREDGLPMWIVCSRS